MRIGVSEELALGFFGLDVLCDLVKRGLRPPATITPDGAIGLTQAIAAVEKGEKRRDAIVERYQHKFPEFCHCLLDDAEAGLNHLAVPNWRES